jgi:hypothetical protein
MSRLEDELRVALGRQEPSSDFTDRVMQRVQAQRAQPQTKTVWWRKVVEMFEPRPVRWAAVGAVILLLIVLVEIGYQKSRSQETAGTKPPEVKDQQDVIKPEDAAPQKREEEKRAANPKPAPGKIARRHLTASRQEREEMRQGEEAKRKLMLALHVTSATLNEAQRIMRDDRAGRE